MGLTPAGVGDGGGRAQAECPWPAAPRSRLARASQGLVPARSRVRPPAGGAQRPGAMLGCEPLWLAALVSSRPPPLPHTVTCEPQCLYLPVTVARPQGEARDGPSPGPAATGQPRRVSRGKGCLSLQKVGARPLVGERSSSCEPGRQAGCGHRFRNHCPQKPHARPHSRALGLRPPSRRTGLLSPALTPVPGVLNLRGLGPRLHAYHQEAASAVAQNHPQYHPQVTAQERQVTGAPRRLPEADLGAGVSSEDSWVAAGPPGGSPAYLLFMAGQPWLPVPSPS